MIRFGALLCLLSQISQASAQSNFNLVWAIAMYGDITASPGDTVCQYVAIVVMQKPSNTHHSNMTFFLTNYQPPAPIYIQVTFEYGANHDVWIHPTGTCEETGKIAVGALGDSPVTYAFTAADAGKTITFACDTGSHCENGQIINFQIGELLLFICRVQIVTRESWMGISPCIFFRLSYG